MESSKLKNMVLTILVITNVLLLSLMLYQRIQGRQYRQQALLDTVDLLRAQGISVSADILPSDDTLPAPMTLERDSAWEKSVFTRLLGEDATLTQRGLVSLYSGSLGAAEVRGDGSFSVSLAPGAYPLASGESMETHAQALAGQLGCDALVASRDDGGVTLVQSYAATGRRARRTYPVFTCAIRVSYENGQAAAISGTRLVGEPTAETQAGEPLSTAALLVRFRAGVIESGAACSAILSATQGYTLDADASGKLRLTPTLQLKTDTGVYLMDALTGALTRS